VVAGGAEPAGAAVVGGDADTTTLPCIVGCTRQWYANVPAASKVRANVWPEVRHGPGIGHAGLESN
jgi:hypothetical protein